MCAPADRGACSWTFARELKTPTMNILRWIAFLPVALITTNLVYLVTGWASVKFPWWGIVILYAIVGIPFGLAGFMSALVAPNRRVGGLVFVGLVVFGELLKIREFVADWPGHLIFWRVVADLLMIHGALTAAASPKDFKIEA